MRSIYTVWFRDPRLPSDDQDHEWPACFTIEAVGTTEAASWGDRVASAHALRTGQKMLSSSVEPFDGANVPGKERLPVIHHGREPSDDDIGW
jgi:hypothetical protein